MTPQITELPPPPFFLVGIIVVVFSVIWFLIICEIVDYALDGIMRILKERDAP